MILLGSVRRIPGSKQDKTEIAPNFSYNKSMGISAQSVKMIAFIRFIC